MPQNHFSIETLQEQIAARRARIGALEAEIAFLKARAVRAQHSAERRTDDAIEPAPVSRRDADDAS